MSIPLTPYPATPAEFVEYQDWWSLMYPGETEEPAEVETPENLNPHNPLRKIRVIRVEEKKRTP